MAKLQIACTKVIKKLEKIYSVDIYDHLVEKINLELKLTRDENYKKLVMML